MASDTLGHHYNELPGVPIELLVCTRCYTVQGLALAEGVTCQTRAADNDQRENAMAGMLAAVEYARTMHGGLAGQVDAADVQEGLDFITADAARGQLDVLGSLASITLRAAELTCLVIDGMTVPKFLDMLETEIYAGATGRPES